jgi:hypothetical protein
MALHTKEIAGQKIWPTISAAQQDIRTQGSNT